jgi:sarcosine oxidase gamma subunit
VRLARLALVVATTAVLAAGTASAATSGSISGTVSGGSGPVCVLVLDATGQAVASAASDGDGDGDYTVEEVPPGSWTVEFDPDDGCLGGQTAQAIQYYSDAGTPATATAVSVSAGETTSGIDGALVTGATITGTIRDGGLSALSGVCVVLEDTAGRPVLRQPTDADGDYTLTQLPPGRFILQFVDDDCAGQAEQYAPIYYPDASTPSDAQVIALQAGQLVGLTDATLTRLSSAGATAGTGQTGASTGTETGTSGKASTPASGPKTSASPKARRKAVVSLLAVAGGRWTVDVEQRLHLRLLCAAGGPACVVTVAVRRPVTHAGRVRGGRRVGLRTLTVRAGRSAATRVALHGIRAGRLWVSVRLRGQKIGTTTVLPVRWEPRVRVRRPGT